MNGSDLGKQTLSPWARAAIAVLPVAAASYGGRFVTLPKIEGWYQSLQKPFFTPPDWVFGPVWGVLYVMMAYAAWRILGLPVSSARTRALSAFFIQLAINAAWSFAFFGLENPILGLIVIVALLVAIIVTIRLVWPLDRVAALLLVPYAAWVAYASAVNAGVAWLNG